MDYDHLDRRRAEALLERVPSYRSCIGCGGCTATCSAGQLTDFNVRRIHTQFKRGDYAGLEERLKACMLCGKCTLVCPRGINTRKLIVEMRRLLAPVPQDNGMEKGGLNG